MKRNILQCTTSICLVFSVGITQVHAQSLIERLIGVENINRSNQAAISEVKALMLQSISLSKGASIKGNDAAFGAEKDKLDDHKDKIKKELDVVSKFLSDKGVDTKAVQDLNSCFAVFADSGKSGTLPSTGDISKCGKDAKEFKEKVQNNYNKTRAAIKNTVETCENLQGYAQKDWSKNFGEILRDAKSFGTDAEDCLNNAKEAYDSLASANNQMSALINTATTVCAASGGNPWVCGIAYGVVILLALLDLGKGGDGDGGNENSDAGKGKVSGDDKGENVCRSPEKCIATNPIPADQKQHSLNANIGGNAGDVKCEWAGSSYMACEVPGFKEKTRILKSITEFTSSNSYKIQGNSRQDDLKQIPTGIYEELGSLMALTADKRVVTICTATKEAVKTAIANNYYSSSATVGGKTEGYSFHSGISYTSNTGGNSYEVWQLFDKEGKEGPKLVNNIATGDKCKTFR